MFLNHSDFFFFLFLLLPSVQENLSGRVDLVLQLVPGHLSLPIIVQKNIYVCMYVCMYVATL